MCRSIDIGIGQYQPFLGIGIGIGLKEPILWPILFLNISINKQNNEDNANFDHFICFCCRKAKICLFDEK